MTVLKILAGAALAAVVAGVAYARVEREEELASVTERHTSSKEAPVEMRLVGFTNEVTAGDVGIFEMHAMCQVEFSARARTCTLAEAQRTVNVPELPMTTAWVNTETFDPASVQRLSDCGGWGDPGAIGAVLDDLGRIERSYCTVRHAVTCCSSTR